MKYFLSILFVTFTINLKANDYRYIGELNGDNIYLYHNMLEYGNEDEFHYNLLYPKSRGNIISKKKYNELIINNKPSTRNNSNNIMAI